MMNASIFMLENFYKTQVLQREIEGIEARIKQQGQVIFLVEGLALAVALVILYILYS